MQVDYIDHMGTDETVTSSARVSFNKNSKNYTEEQNNKLIKYLANHGHFTPFTHPMITMREKVPIFVARQIFKHQIGFSRNEVSRRYVDEAPEFFTPKEWRGKPINAKQGSSEVIIEPDLHKEILILDRTYEGNFGDTEGFWFEYGDIIKLCADWYQNAIENGVAPEQARMILPQSMYTEFYSTGSLAAWARAYKLRIDHHTQKETQELAKRWDEIIRPLFPVSWSALVD